MGGLRAKMGGGYYDREVEVVAPQRNNSTRRAAPAAKPAFSAAAASNLTGGFKTPIRPAADPKNRTVVCTAKDPIVVAVDMTGSMGDWPKVIWDKLPMFFGQLMLQGYVEDPQLAFCGTGDTLSPGNNSAYKPVQVTEFASGSAIDDELKKISVASGNGPKKNYEAYGLAMFFWARCAEFPNADGKPILFLTSDEFFYPSVPSEHILKTFGIRHPTVQVSDLMKELRQKYEVFVIRKVYDTYKGFEESIAQQWQTLISGERILRLDEPKAVVDVMLGAISLAKGTRTLDKYGEDMRTRGQDSQRIDLVNSALAGLAGNVDADQASLAAELAAAQAELAALRAATSGAAAESCGLSRELSNELVSDLGRITQEVTPKHSGRNGAAPAPAPARQYNQSRTSYTNVDGKYVSGDCDGYSRKQRKDDGWGGI